MIAQLALIILLASHQVRGDSDDEALSHNVEKRSVSILARMGQLPYQPGKRYVAALARNGELASYPRPAWNKKYQHSLEDLEERLEEEGLEKRYLGALARSGDLRGSREEKRDDLEGLMRELEEGRRLRLEALREELGEGRRGDGEDLYSNEDLMGEEKRGGISSLAKGGNYGFPKRTSDDDLEELMSEVYGIDSKRNVASMARGSLLKSGALSRPSKKDLEEDDWDEYGEEKRNLPSLLRDRAYPLGEGKRHIGSVLKGFTAAGEKRNLGSLARSRDFPMAYERKRDDEEMSKRYVAALLRQGRLPVGEHQSDEEEEAAAAKEEEEAEAAAAHGPHGPSDKSSEGPEAQGARKKKSAEVGEMTRAKRETFVPLPALSSDYILPVVRDSGFVDSEDKWVDDYSSPINKRYFAVRGGGKIPGGRLPQIGQRRRGHMNSGRRRGH